MSGRSFVDIEERAVWAQWAASALGAFITNRDFDAPQETALQAVECADSMLVEWRKRRDGDA